MNQEFSKTKVFQKDDVELYAKLTGDYNPVHFDEEFAKHTIFGKPIIHGPLVLTFVTTLFATDLPGPGTVYLAHDVKFLNPVYVGDEITATLKIQEITDKNHIFVSTTCTNQNNEVVMTGLARLKKMG